MNSDDGNELEERTLTVINYTSDEDGTPMRARVTIAPNMVQFLIASDETYTVLEGRELRRVNVILSTGNNLELYLTLLELTILERAVGTYFVSNG